MGLFSKECVICHHEKSGVKRNNRGWNVCRDCRNAALSKMSESEYQNANIREISAASKVNGSLTKNIEYCIASNMNAEETLNQLKPDMEFVDVVLKDGEICYYEGDARAYNEKNLVTSYKSVSNGVSVRVVKGVTIRTGSSMSIPIRSIVSETSEGNLIITNLRFMMLSPKYGFNIDRDKVDSIEQFKNGFRLYSCGKCHTVITYDNGTIMYVLNTMNKYFEEKPIESEKIIRKKADNSIADEIKKFKELLDDGAITQDEYDKKKNELLGKN